MSEASEALADVRGWLCENLNASDAGHVCGMLSVVSRRVVQADRLEAENTKLHELAKKLKACNSSCGRCIELYGICEHETELREFGIEVD